MRGSGFVLEAPRSPRIGLFNDKGVSVPGGTYTPTPRDKQGSRGEGTERLRDEGKDPTSSHIEPLVDALGLTQLNNGKKRVFEGVMMSLKQRK